MPRLLRSGGGSGQVSPPSRSRQVCASRTRVLPEPPRRSTVFVRRLRSTGAPSLASGGRHRSASTTLHFILFGRHCPPRGPIGVALAPTARQSCAPGSHPAVEDLPARRLGHLQRRLGQVCCRSAAPSPCPPYALCPTLPQYACSPTNTYRRARCSLAGPRSVPHRPQRQRSTLARSQPPPSSWCRARPTTRLGYAVTVEASRGREPDGACCKKRPAVPPPPLLLVPPPPALRLV